MSEENSAPPPPDASGDPRASQEQEQDQPQAKPEALAIDWSTEPTPAYVNGAHVIHSPTEFSVVFTEMNGFPGRLASDGEAGHERAAVVASIRANPTVFFEMMCVFASNWNKFANDMIDPRMRKPRFKLLDAGDFQLDNLPPKAREE